MGLGNLLFRMFTKKSKKNQKDQKKQNTNADVCIHHNPLLFR